MMETTSSSTSSDKIIYDSNVAVGYLSFAPPPPDLYNLNITTSAINY